MEAVKEVYGEQEVDDPADFLPPLNEIHSDLRNPAVSRVLNELRKVFNSVIREYGKPTKIRVELARDLKNNRRNRQEIHKRYNLYLLDFVNY